MTTTLLETCQISPPPTLEPSELTLPLTFLDILWLHFHPIHRLLFYEHPSISKAYFLETLVPKLKQSLSPTLKHYLPVSGNLLYPLKKTDEKKPVFRYLPGDSVSLKISESSCDNFDDLIANHARDADKFYDFVPEMPPFKDETDYKIIPVLALQVTLFPGRGICIGLANHHSLGDASSIAGFIWAWARVCKLGPDLTEKDEPLPIFDRSLIKDTLGIDAIYWNFFGEMPLKESTFPLPTNRVRATYVFHQGDIKRLKDLVLAARPGLVRVSSFVVITSYVWSCLVKSGDAVGEEVDCNFPDCFVFTADARARLNPPVPANYFGNCLGYGIAKLEHQQMVGDDGFVIAAEAIAEDIKNRVNKDDLLKGAENWISDMKNFVGIRALGVSGSPKFDLSNADFGWGKARKLEVVSIDGEKYSMSLCKSRDSEGGLEVGLSLPKARMEAFASIFASGLKSSHES